MALQLSSNDARVVQVRHAGRNAWLKRSAPPHPRWRYTLLDLASRALDIPLGRPVPKPGGVQTLEIERRRIEQLMSAGIPVPDVLETGPDWHMLADVGESLRDVLRKTDPAERPVVCRRVIVALHDVHRKGHYLSQAFDRNICVAGEDISFIDFEDDPLMTFDLGDAQARDWLLLLSSLAQHFENDASSFMTICREAFEGMSSGLEGTLVRNAQRVRRLLRGIPGAPRVRELRRLILFGNCVDALQSQASAIAAPVVPGSEDTERNERNQHPGGHRQAQE